MRKSRRHILLLEGSRDIYLAFDALFQHVHGYAVHRVETIKEATGLTDRLEIDLAVIDLAYGPEVTSRLNMLRSWRHRGDGLPVIATSAHDYDGLSIEAFSAGADDYLRKPFRFAEMAARIERHLARSGAASSRTPRADGMRLPPASFQFAGAVIHPDLRASFPDGSAVQFEVDPIRWTADRGD